LKKRQERVSLRDEKKKKRLTPLKKLDELFSLLRGREGGGRRVPTKEECSSGKRPIRRREKTESLPTEPRSVKGFDGRGRVLLENRGRHMALKQG